MEAPTFWQKVQRWVEIFDFTTQDPYLYYHRVQANEIEALKARISDLENVK